MSTDGKVEEDPPLKPPPENPEASEIFDGQRDVRGQLGERVNS